MNFAYVSSQVNPVLREGNSDRRVAGPVKAYAQKNPHKLMPWEPSSKTHVAHMSGGDFFANEQSAIMSDECSVKIHCLGDDSRLIGLPGVVDEIVRLLQVDNGDVGALN